MRRFRAFIAILLFLLLPPQIWSSNPLHDAEIVEISRDLVASDDPFPSSAESLKFKLAPDGTIHATDGSGKHFWSFSSGPSSLVVVEPIAGWNHDDEQVQEELHEHLKEFIARGSWFSEDRQVVVMGSSLKSVFVIDPKTGTLIYKFDVNGTTFNAEARARLASKTDGFKPIFFERTDHSLQCFEISTGLIKWSVRFAEIASLNEEDDEQEFGSNSTTALVVDRERKTFKDGLQGSKFTPISVEPMEIFNYIMNNRTLSNNPAPVEALKHVFGVPNGNQTFPLPLPSDGFQSPELPNPGSESHFKAVSFGWITGGFLALGALITLMAIYFRGKLKKVKTEEPVVPKEKEKRKKRKSPKARAVQENASKHDQDMQQKVNGKIGNMVITNIAIGYGSHGTRILEGYLDGRHVAIKSVLSAFYDKASKEISALIALDAHPNVVRYFAMEQSEQFVNIALERCSFNLETFILAHTAAGDQRTEVNKHESEELELVLQENFIMWDTDGFPTALLMKLMRDVVDGLVHLHKLGYIHRDLKPQNVLIRRNGKILVAKLSDMGISKRLKDGAFSIDKLTCTGKGSSGWHAPEQIHNGRQTRAVDMFSVGCLLYFCITAGRHPFGEELERDLNIVRGKMDFFPIEHLPEATHLLSGLLDLDPEKRPTSLELSLHPFFWSSQKRLSFLIAASDRVEREDREASSAVLQALEAVASTALGGPWNEKLDTLLIENLGRYRQYNYQAVRDILRVIRNKANHYRELPPDLQNLLGAIPQGYENYFRTRFPKLLMEVYKVLLVHCRAEDLFRSYFEESSEF